MQYKTVTVEHSLAMSRREAGGLGEKYQNVINNEASQGWKLLGIHTLPIKQRAGCAKMLFGVFWECYNLDVLVFFRD